MPIADSERFRVFECPDLEGTFAARITSLRPEVWTTGLINVRYGERQCPARIDAVLAGAQNQIELDPQLHSYLAAGSSRILAEVFPCALAPCRTIELQVPEGVAGQPTREAWLRSRLTSKPLAEGLEIRLYGVLSGEAHEVPVRITRIDPAPFAEILPSTEVLFRPLCKARESHVGVRWRDVAGLDHAVTMIRELVEFPTRHADLAATLGIEPPRGILLHGPPGTGKTLIARALANELDAHFFFIQGPEIVSAFIGESEKAPSQDIRAGR
jgi:transitional endoplasmic reticulum ATPase